MWRGECGNADDARWCIFGTPNYRKHPILCKTATNVAALATSLLFAIAGFWVQSLDGYLLVGDIDGGAVIDPLSKQVQIQSGAWLTNFYDYPWLWLLPALGF